MESMKQCSTCRNFVVIPGLNGERDMYFCDSKRDQVAPPFVGWLHWDAPACEFHQYEEGGRIPRHTPSRRLDAAGYSSNVIRQEVMIVLPASTLPSQPASPLPTPKKSPEGPLIKGVAFLSLAIVAVKLLGAELPPGWGKTLGAFLSSGSGVSTLVASSFGVLAGVLSRWIKL
jgi:hypothetical protein